MNQAERRKSIIQAATLVFAQKGFRGATTKDLAEAADVSEALLYKHFPSKESLYASIEILRLRDSKTYPEFDKLRQMPPSTRRLVICIQFLFTHYAGSQANVLPRLMAQSLLEDGMFARTFLQSIKAEIFETLKGSLNAAKAAGDLVEDVKVYDLPIWFTHHLAMSFKLMDLPEKPAVGYNKSRRVVVDHIVRFALRGIGLKPSAIKKYYRPYS